MPCKKLCDANCVSFLQSPCGRSCIKFICFNSSSSRSYMARTSWTELHDTTGANDYSYSIHFRVLGLYSHRQDLYFRRLLSGQSLRQHDHISLRMFCLCGMYIIRMYSNNSMSSGPLISGSWDSSTFLYLECTTCTLG